MTTAELAVYFANLLLRIKRNDAEYELRYGLILQAVTCAHSLGYPAGFRVDPKETDWPVAFIELPTGQVSWHMPQHVKEWDGHNTGEKFRRIDEYTELVAAVSPLQEAE